MVLVLKVVDREAAMGDCETETTQVFEIFIWLGHYTAQASIMSWPHSNGIIHLLAGIPFWGVRYEYERLPEGPGMP